MTSSAPIIPDYANPELTSPSTWPVRIATGCGFLPLIVGSSIFALYVVTRWQLLPVFGFLTILAGIVVVVAGFVFLSVYTVSHRRAGVGTPRRPFWTAVLVLLLNFPLGLTLANAGKYLMDHVTIVVTNTGTQTVDKVRIDEKWSTPIDLGPVRPGDSVRHRVDIAGGTGVIVHITQSGAALPPQDLGYFCSKSSPGTIRVSVNDGSVTKR